MGKLNSRNSPAETTEASENNDKEVKMSEVSSIQDDAAETVGGKMVVAEDQACTLVNSRKTADEKWIQEQTADYVERIGKAATIEVTAWVAVGDLVDEYARTIQSEFRRKIDAYARLAQHPGAIKLQAGQMRNYCECSKLYHAIEAEAAAPKLQMTFYVAVLGGAITNEQRLAALMQAERETLSVSKLKKLIKNQKVAGNTVSGRRASSDTWGTGKLSRHSKCLCSAIGAIRQKGTDCPPIPPAVEAKVRDSLLKIFKYAVSQRFLSVDDLKVAESEANQAMQKPDLVFVAAA